MDIQITPTKTDGIERLLRVEVSAEAVRKAQEQAARRYSSKVRLPGFRPGKAPPAMVLKRFADAIRQETVESIVQEAYKQVVEGATFKLASQPHVHDLKYEDGQALSFEQVAAAPTRGDLSLVQVPRQWLTYRAWAWQETGPASLVRPADEVVTAVDWKEPAHV